MDNQQIALSYALAKCLGYDKSVDSFAKEYDQYYKEAIERLDSESKPKQANFISSPI